MKVIALEEHYLDPEVGRHFSEAGPEAKVPALRDRLLDVGALRIKEMDEAGVDLQILSHTAPATQRLDAETALQVAREANDRLKATVDKSNGRFLGFASLPTANPKAAADELERAVTKLGFKGAMIHGLTGTEPSLHRRQALLADLRARAGARRADLPASGGAAPGRDRGLLQGLRQGIPEHPHRRLGLRRRDRDAGAAHGALRRVREVPG